VNPSGKRFVVTGGRGSFGAPLMELLRDAGAADVQTLGFGSDWSYDDLTAFDPLLATADVLVLAHGAKVEHAMEANCDSFVALIERFRAASDGVAEVWAVGSEIECHPHWGNEELKIYKASKMAYARFARRYARDGGLIYRHIVPSAFTSKMGPGLISGRTAARWALGLIRVGVRYVPVSYTGIALLNWFRHRFGERASDADVKAITG
jgi:monoglucosyldiacylglycerol epimerase